MITQLTKEQEERIPEYIDKWVAVASQPLDREKTVRITKELFGEDKIVLIAESIKNAIDIINFIYPGKKAELKSELYSELHSQLGSGLYSELDSELCSELRSELCSQLHSELYLRLKSELYSELRSELESELHSQLYSELSSQLDSELYSELYSELNSQLHSELYSELHSELSSQLDSELYSELRSELESELGSKISYGLYTTQYWLAWLGYYDYAHMIGLKFNEEKRERMTDIVTAIPTIINLGKIMIVIENPTCRWENRMLHSDQKPAIEWKDETGIYFLDGVKLEKEMWERIISHTMTFSEIMAIEISDQRTVALKYNPEAILNEGAELMHKDTRNNELYLIENQTINEELGHPKIWFLKMLCPTGRVFIEGVPPEEAEKNPNATDMQALLCGLTRLEYDAMVMES